MKNEKLGGKDEGNQAPGKEAGKDEKVESGKWKLET
jgi:hypothetical protein